MTGGKDEDALDPLRAAFIAQAQEEPPPIPDEPFSTTDEATYAQCISPREALSRLGLSAVTSITQLRRELEHDRVEAVAQEAVWGDLNKKRVVFALVPAWVWMRRELTPQDDFWDTGYLFTSFPGRTYSIDNNRSISFFAIKFWPGGLPGGEAAEPAVEQRTGQASAALGKGGRPAKPWWDELWAEIGAQLYNGGLKPSRLADIEKAMHEWVAARGDTVGETPIRKAAKLLWDAIHRED